MAQFRDLIITGPSRFLDTMYLNEGLVIEGDLSVGGETTLNKSVRVGENIYVSSGLDAYVEQETDDPANLNQIFRGSFGRRIGADDHIIASSLEFLGDSTFEASNYFSVTSPQITLIAPEDAGSITISAAQSDGEIHLGELIGDIDETIATMADAGQTYVPPKIYINNDLSVNDVSAFYKNTTFYGQEARVDDASGELIPEIGTYFTDGPVVFSWTDANGNPQVLGKISGGNLDFSGTLTSGGDYAIFANNILAGKNLETLSEEIAADSSILSLGDYISKQSHKFSFYGSTKIEGETKILGGVFIGDKDLNVSAGLSVNGAGSFNGNISATQSLNLDNSGNNMSINFITGNQNNIEPVIKTDIAGNNAGFYINPNGQEWNNGLAMRYESDRYNLYWLGELLSTQEYVDSKSDSLEDKLNNALADDFLSKKEGGSVLKPVEVQGTFSVGETSPSTSHRVKLNYDETHGCLIVSFA